MNFMEKLTTEQVEQLTSFVDENGLTSEELRRGQAILLVQEEASEALIEKITGIKRDTAVKLRKKFVKFGLEALRSKRKGKTPRSRLTKKQRAEIADILNTKTPEGYGWTEQRFWTTKIVGALILELYAVQYTSRTPLYLVFKESRFSYHKPEKIYKQRNQKAIDEWKEKNAPEIEKAWHDSNTVILVADEMILTSQTTTQRVWLPRGVPTKIECSNTRKRRCISGFLDLKAGQEYAFKSERLNNETCASILKQVLAHYSDKNVLLLWDNAPWHFGDFMRAFLATCTNLHITNFPTYAPDENPQEHVWKAGRSNVTHNRLIKDIDTATRELLMYLNNSTFKYEFLGFKAL